jgi:hypothetical protein
MKLFAAAFAAALATMPMAAMAQDTAPAEAAAPAKANQPIAYFFGIFEGMTKVVEGAGADTEAAGRLSRVVTEADGTGFMLTWSTLYIDEENPSVLKIKDSTEIRFAPTENPALFKQVKAPELWTGKPHYWARIDGDTLNVTAVVLDADGTYDITHYARTVQGDAMRLEFTRFKDGIYTRHVTGTLERKAE